MSKCPICYENRCKYIFIPCGHICLCNDCYMIFLKNKIFNCPLCRNIGNIYKIYHIGKSKKRKRKSP